MKYTYEIFLKHAQVAPDEWSVFIAQIAHYLGSFVKWRIYVVSEQNVVHYYLESPLSVPVSPSSNSFLLKPADLDLVDSHAPFGGFYYNARSDNYVAVYQDLHKYHYRLQRAILTFHGAEATAFGRAQIFYTCHGRHYAKRLLRFCPSTFLSIDFTKAKSFLFKKFPKYLKLNKVVKLLTPHSEQSLLQVDSFPYLDGNYCLRHDRYDFFKHSLVIGGSGSGKSRLLASLIDKVSQTSSEQYKIVVIDPHDALYRDCTSVASQSVVNFQDVSSSISLFPNDTTNLTASVELMLTLFRSLINDNYNGHLERVLRYSTYLLMIAQSFSFLTLRKLLLDVEFRNNLLARYEKQVPASVAHFFLADFIELKSQNYNDAIAPIIAFIDELLMVPVFSTEASLPDISDEIQHNFLNIFSLNRLRLGTKAVQTLAGLLMQQLFLFAQQPHDWRLIVIIDEVSVIETPIITRFLAELRKYNTFVILAGQYFNQISPELQSAIFANVSNYYLFHVSRHDASLLASNLKIKIEGSDDPEDAIGILTGLKQRECLVQITHGEESLPIFKARTIDYEVIPQASIDLLEQPSNFPNSQNFSTDIIPAQDISQNKQKVSQAQNSAKSPESNNLPNNFFSSTSTLLNSDILDVDFTFPADQSTTNFNFDSDDVSIDQITQKFTTNRKSKGE